MILIIEFHFSAAHFYEQKKWSTKRNEDVFGKCFTPQGHGHNYRLELEIDIGQRPPIKAKAELNMAIQKTIDVLDHRHLNFDIPHFKSIVPTTENISLYLKDQIKIPPPYSLTKLRLFEMDSIFVELTV